MPKGKNEGKDCCTEHIFQMHAEQSDCYYQENMKANLCPHIDKHGKCSSKKSFEGPVYNKDMMASTPAFVLKSQKDKFKSSASIAGNQNGQKCFNGGESKSQLLFPKPSSKSFYCNVCKQKYDDYRQVNNIKMQHIQGQKHKNKIKANPFNKHILKFASKYEKQRCLKEKEKAAFLPTLSEGSNLIVIDQQSDNEVQSKPRKQVKVQKDTSGFDCNAPMMDAYSFIHAQQIIAAQQRIYQYYTALNHILHNQMPYGYYPFNMAGSMGQPMPGMNPMLGMGPMFNHAPEMMSIGQPGPRCFPVSVNGPINPREQSGRQQLIIIQDDI